jgi:hypothetical protein
VRLVPALHFKLLQYYNSAPFTPQTWLLAVNPFMRRTTESVAGLNFCSRHLVLAADALLQIGTAVISVVLSLDEDVINTSSVPKFVTSRCTVVLFGTFFSGYELQNASRIPANDFDAT